MTKRKPKSEHKPTGKNPGGRPTKYKKEYCDEIIEFFNAEPYEDVEVPHYHKSGEVSWEDTKRMPNKLPTMIEFAKHIGVGYRTLYEWLDPKSGSYQEEFSQTYTRICKKLQKNFLIQNGLQGLNNPIFTKFVAINFTDMVDKKEVGHSGSIDLRRALDDAEDSAGVIPAEDKE